MRQEDLKAVNKRGYPEIDDGIHRSYLEIGTELGVTPQACQQVAKKAIRKLWRYGLDGVGVSKLKSLKKRKKGGPRIGKKRPKCKEPKVVSDRPVAKRSAGL